MWKIQGKVGRPDGFVNAGNVVNVEVEEGAVVNVKISWERLSYEAHRKRDGGVGSW